MSGLLLGVDIGSSATKVALVDPEQGILAVASRPATLHSHAAGWAEAEPAQWWENLCALIPEVAANAGIASEAIGAISVAGMVPAVLVLDDAGVPLRRAILQNDARAVVELASLQTALAGVDLLGLTGSALTQQSVAPTLVWLASHEPECMKRARFIMGSYDWLARALGAELHCETNWALESGLFSIAEHQILPAVLEAAQLSPALFAPVRSAGTSAGGVGREASKATGLRYGTPIVVGGADHVLSAYGAGCEQPGDWLIKLGGAGDILVVADTPLLDPRLYLDVHPAPKRWLPNGCMATSGSLLGWLWSISGQPDATQLEREAAEAPPATLTVLPYFLGEKSPLHDPDLRGAILGLQLSHSRADIYRGAIEAIAYGFKHHLEIFAEHGLALGRARVTNGGSRSRLWKQVTADVLGTDLHPIKDHPGAALGAAICAGIGTGAVRDWGVIERLVAFDDPVVPNRENTERYQDGYELYRAAGEAVAPISHRIAQTARRQTESQPLASVQPEVVRDL